MPITRLQQGWIWYQIYGTWSPIIFTQVSVISQIFVTPEHPDRLVFAPNEHGNFSTKAYITLSRRGGAARLWARWIWQHSYNLISRLFYGKWFGTLCQWMNALNRGMFTWCPDVTAERFPKSPLYISSSTHRLRVRFGSDLHTYYNSKMSADLFSRFWIYGCRGLPDRPNMECVEQHERLIFSEK